MFELDVTAMSGNKSRMELFGPGMQRAEEGAFFSGGPEIQWGANRHTYFASGRTGTTVLIGPVWFLGLFLDRSDRIDC